MSIAQEITTTPDRTARERRDMAEFRAVRFDWPPGCRTIVYYFRDGSALMVELLPESLEPFEFLAVDA